MCQNVPNNNPFWGRENENDYKGLLYKGVASIGGGASGSAGVSGLRLSSRVVPDEII